MPIPSCSTVTLVRSSWLGIACLVQLERPTISSTLLSRPRQLLLYYYTRNSQQCCGIRRQDESDDGESHWSRVLNQSRTSSVLQDSTPDMWEELPAQPTWMDTKAIMDPIELFALRNAIRWSQWLERTRLPANHRVVQFGIHLRSCKSNDLVLNSIIPSSPTLTKRNTISI